MARQPTLDPDPRSTVQVVQDAAEHAQMLLRSELELAKIEIRDALAKQAMAAGLAIAGAVFGLFVLGFVGVTVAVALQEVLWPWAAWGVVTLGYLVIGLVALLIAKRTAAKANLSPERTKQSIEENVEWAKQQMRR